VSIVTYSEVHEHHVHRDLVSTIMFYLYIVVMTNKITEKRIEHSFSVCSS